MPRPTPHVTGKEAGTEGVVASYGCSRTATGPLRFG